MEILLKNTGNFTIIDDEDYPKVKYSNWYELKGYAVRMTAKCEGKKKMLYMHRIIVPSAGGYLIDHINRNRLDNRKENLRIATRAQNNINRERVKGAQSPYRGVIWRPHAKAWKAYIKKDHKQIHLGYFLTPEKAALKYNEKAVELFGRFAVLNDVRLTLVTSWPAGATEPIEEWL
jgi:hypothetical protein